MKLNILIVEPFFAGSHAIWAQGYVENSIHNVSILSLPGRHWKWRMHGGAITLAEKFNELSQLPDVIIASDMLDVSLFISLVRHKIGDIPVITYFHENQLTYPWSSADSDVGNGRDAHYGFINYTSAMISDGILFNSHFHLNSFTSTLETFLHSFPDYQNYSEVSHIRNKSKVIYPGIDTELFDLFQLTAKPSDPLLIIWNHRWEYDKNPEEFFKALKIIKKNSIPFKLAVLGEKYHNSPKIFGDIQSEFCEHIVHFGFADNIEDYAKILQSGSILPVTSNQDFFGISIIEAIYCGLQPLLPVRLSYPELIPKEYHDKLFYSDFDDLVRKLETTLTGYDHSIENICRSIGIKYSWAVIGKKLDEFMQLAVSEKKTKDTT
ncbi:MAG: DUF3524 domain-containing protein [Candidatus Marinimicrobia bacterium]|jgi:glycosyltransferase involved in cell wall biosynthesis|nr:DUF3524 domain-containing protein [Candidatus Neomarinimicrobiota bacterium]MBT3633621.1 DUF3524 domain-containing protein [Candidatus Neomarinimicrobiota bacterium]MBT3682426.1 DUF3524 domain-containing protein [Candidatus Neomarinimicrobiota bacterium]MBT3759190.1 DUF3524 domain-containing protein [Candidatus Neomarinimicrobiota bacterium]MBT3895537.1 DUF3524 domain-containing protein [Candidatus Neomarinimicrobiota bacterium]